MPPTVLLEQDDELGKDGNTALKDFLISCSANMVQARNDRNYNQLLEASYIASNFTAELDYEHGRSAVDLDGHIQMYQRIVQDFPLRHLHLRDSSVTIDAQYGTATVYQNMELTGHPPGVLQTRIAVLSWRCVRGKWLCVKSIGMRGMGIESR